MIDLMLIGGLRAPHHPDDPISQNQLVQLAREAADRIEADAERIAELERNLSAHKTAIDELGPSLETVEYTLLEQARENGLTCLESALMGEDSEIGGEIAYALLVAVGRQAERLQKDAEGVE